MAKCEFCGKNSIFTIVDSEGNCFCNGDHKKKYSERKSNIIEVLEEIYNNEINFEISCFWDNGFSVRIGDPMNGNKWRGTGFNTLFKALNALINEANKEAKD